MVSTWVWSEGIEKARCLRFLSRQCGFIIMLKETRALVAELLRLKGDSETPYPLLEQKSQDLKGALLEVRPELKAGVKDLEASKEGISAIDNDISDRKERLKKLFGEQNDQMRALMRA